VMEVYACECGCWSASAPAFLSECASMCLQTVYGSSVY
jgi:hypothetical protein